jgi:hypothetical protein
MQDDCLDGRPIARMIDCRRQPTTNAAAGPSRRAGSAIAQLTTARLIRAGAPR